MSQGQRKTTVKLTQVLKKVKLNNYFALWILEARM